MKEDDFKSGDRRDGGRPTTGRRDDARSRSENTPRPRRDDRPDSDASRRYTPGRRSDDQAGSRPFGRDTNSSNRDNDRPRLPFNRPENPDRRSGDSHSDDRPRPSYNRERSTERRSADHRQDEGTPRPSYDRDRSAGQSAPRPERPARPGAPRFGNTPPTERREEYPKPAFDRNNNARHYNKGGNDRPRYNDRPAPRFDRDAPPVHRPDDQPRAEQTRDSLNERSRDERPADTSRQRSGENRFGQERRYPERPTHNRASDTHPTTPRDEERRPYNRETGSGNPNRRDSRPATGSSNDSNERPFPRRDDRRSGPSSDERRVGRFDRAPNYDANAMRNSIPPRKREEIERAEKHDNRNTEPGTIRLNRYIANAGICSRREADALIAQGTVQVNGKVVTEMGHKVQQGDVVKYGNRILNPEKMVYVLLNKPKDYITTTDDPEERRTVMELVADAGPFRIYPVGRLDRNTTGLMLMTNDGELAEKLTHPSNEIKKVYQVELDKPITDEHFEAILKGIELEDGTIRPDALSIITPDAQVVGIEIHSGRNRIVRRIFEHLGYEVTKLDRTSYAGLTKKELPRGKWRFLEPKEVVKLKYLQ